MAEQITGTRVEVAELERWLTAYVDRIDAGDGTDDYDLAKMDMIADLRAWLPGSIGVRVSVAICPICGSHVEWQGNDFGYLCQGPVDDRHSEANAVPTAGTFYADVVDA